MITFNKVQLEKKKRKKELAVRGLTQPYHRVLPSLLFFLPKNHELPALNAGDFQVKISVHLSRTFEKSHFF